MSQQNMFNVMATQQNYSLSELKIRRLPEYEVLKNQINKAQTKQVNKWKQDFLEIQIYSDRNQNQDSKRQIKEPICFEDCQHTIIDLYDILDPKYQQIACTQCKKKPTKQNIKSETFYKQLVTKINEKSFYCSFYAGRVFHTYQKKNQYYSHEILKEEKIQGFLQQIIDNTDQEWVQNHLIQAISQIFRNQSINIKPIIKLPLHCLINAQKIIIPIMFVGCEHLECYEYSNILKLINDEKKQKQIFRRSSIKCFHQDCDNQIFLDYNLLIKKKKILFPAELSESISKEYSFALNVSWNYQYHKFVYNKQSIYDYEYFDQIKKQLLKDVYHFQIFSFLQHIVNKEISKNLHNKLKFSSYKINLTNILYPTRCEKCPMNQCFDLLKFIPHMLQSKEQKNKLKCLACGNILDLEKLEQQIYFDGYLSSELQKNQQPNLNNFNYNQSNLAFKTYILQYQTLKFEQVVALYKTDNINPYPSPDCSMSQQKQRLVQPIVLPECRKKRAFEYDNFFSYMMKMKFSFSTFKNDYSCDCEFCSQVETFKLRQFYLDPTFQKILDWYPKCWEKNINTLLISFMNGKILEKPKIILTESLITVKSTPQFQNNEQSDKIFEQNNYNATSLQEKVYYKHNPQFFQSTQQNYQYHQTHITYNYNQQYQQEKEQNQNNQKQPLKNNFMEQQPNQPKIHQIHQEPVNNEYFFVNGEFVHASLYNSGQFSSKFSTL